MSRVTPPRVGVFLLFFFPSLLLAAIPEQLKLTPWFGTDGNPLTRPVWLGEVPALPGSFVVIEQGNVSGTGRASLLEFRSGQWTRTPFTQLPVRNTGLYTVEMGLLGFAFHPDFANNRKYYLSYNPPAPSPMKTIIEERTASPDYRGDSGVPGRVVMDVAQPQDNHNGGSIAFDPDGYLLVGLGDGGGAGDGHGPSGNGQDPGTLLGSIVRVDVDSPAGGMGYGIPAGNPFAGLQDSTLRDETWIYGLRNPWKFSFDRLTGDFWVGDVGQNLVEEVGILKPGENGGWRVMEGTTCFNPQSLRNPLPSCDNAGMVPPIHEYGRDEGVCVIGGYVYRGNPSSPFYGVYIFGDFGSSRLWGLRQEGRVRLEIREWSPAPGAILSFAEDLAGDLYLLADNGIIYRLDLGNPAVVGHPPPGQFRNPIILRRDAEGMAHFDLGGRPGVDWVKFFSLDGKRFAPRVLPTGAGGASISIPGGLAWMRMQTADGIIGKRVVVY